MSVCVVCSVAFSFLRFPVVSPPRLPTLFAQSRPATRNNAGFTLSPGLDGLPAELCHQAPISSSDNVCLELPRRPHLGLAALAALAKRLFLVLGQPEHDAHQQQPVGQQRQRRIA